MPEFLTIFDIEWYHNDRKVTISCMLDNYEYLTDNSECFEIFGFFEMCEILLIGDY